MLTTVTVMAAGLVTFVSQNGDHWVCEVSSVLHFTFVLLWVLLIYLAQLQIGTHLNSENSECTETHTSRHSAAVKAVFCLNLHQQRLIVGPDEVSQTRVCPCHRLLGECVAHWIIFSHMLLLPAAAHRWRHGTVCTISRCPELRIGFYRGLQKNTLSREVKEWLQNSLNAFLVWGLK